ncbi:MAG: ABC transporter ATP-binding protein [Vannielia sp.]|uniref:ABC transporter ATP-binding protein n=1 Tax=Vannielia sp. TaxID=2813045 RepID=UPI003B8EAC47
MTANTAQGKPTVEVRGLTKIYGDPVTGHIGLKDVSLEVGAGEFVVLLGPSGCGKTTLLRCIAGLERPQAGQVAVGGRTVFCGDTGTWLPPEKRNLSMVFQSYALWPHLNVEENIAFPLKCAGVAKAEIAERVAEVLETVGLADFRRSYVGQLSGGQQQRVALARAIVGRADVVLFDEPLSNLDAKVRETLRHELVRLQREIGFAAVFVTHDQDEAMVLGDRIVVMNKGCVAQQGSGRGIFQDSQSRYVADFVGRTNEVAGTVVAVEGNMARIMTGLGEILGRCAEPLSPGQPATVMFRPHVCAPGADTANRIEGSVERSIFLGTSVDVILRVGDQDLTLSLPDDANYQAGDRISFGVDPERVRVFAANRAAA